MPKTEHLQRRRKECRRQYPSLVNCNDEQCDMFYKIFLTPMEGYPEDLNAYLNESKIDFLANTKQWYEAIANWFLEGNIIETHQMAETGRLKLIQILETMIENR